VSNPPEYNKTNFPLSFVILLDPDDEAIALLIELELDDDNDLIKFKLKFDLKFIFEFNLFAFQIFTKNFYISKWLNLYILYKY